MVVSRTGILILALKDEFPKRSVFVRFEKLNLEIWGSILFRLLIRVYLLLRNRGPWRRK